MSTTTSVTWELLSSINESQSTSKNKETLDSSDVAGIAGLAKKLNVNIQTGLTSEQVVAYHALFGDNSMPATKMKSYFEILLGALSDTILLVLLASAAVSFGLGYWQDPMFGWIEGAAIFIAVFLVSNIAAFNDYSKELQFRALEASSNQDERTSVLRNGVVELINPCDLVVGDVVILQGGDKIPTDAVLIDPGCEITSNESALTGEPDDLRKSTDGKDPFLLSSCLVTSSAEGGQGARALVIGTGMKSQWGKIKANLVSEPSDTPLQEKLGHMATLIGYMGVGASIGTFIALVVQIWAHPASVGDDPPGSVEITRGFVNAFVLAVTIIVVAIPEGLPLAVTIALAYSTKKMYTDKCFIRVLAACETMGNATTICSDKTGTLTENRMTVVDGWFGGKSLPDMAESSQNKELKELLNEQVSINRTAYFVAPDHSKTIAAPPSATTTGKYAMVAVTAEEESKKMDGNLRDTVRLPVVGSKTEGAMMYMVHDWGFDCEASKTRLFNTTHDKVFPFNSVKKRSSAVVHLPSGTIRLYTKGASELLLKDCTKVFDAATGQINPLTPEINAKLEKKISDMADAALRTLVLAHRDFPSVEALPENWATCPPELDMEMVCDCIVGIQDPLRPDVTAAVATARRAGVVVRMVTGDNIQTAKAIARQCGILTEGGRAVEGPDLRRMTPAELDAILPDLQVVARASPEDKYLLVTRLNGYAMPANKEEWLAKHADKVGVTWEDDRDKLLPGYKEEWDKAHPGGGQVVGVTGDGTNDAPALKAADVGMAMGITGTKVAQDAADVVILDDKFSSIVKAILWGRCVYDAIRRFLQFQLTVNIVALMLVFIGAVTGRGEPLNAVMMLWVNLVMDTLGALALATEPPNPAMLQRRPYKRDAPLVSRPMWRNIFVQAFFQLAVCFGLMFGGHKLFNVHEGEACLQYTAGKGSSQRWDTATHHYSDSGTITCDSFKSYYPAMDYDGFHAQTVDVAPAGLLNNFRFADLHEYEAFCLSCTAHDYRHGTIIFNAFIFCQLWNEYTSRMLFDEWNMFEGVQNNSMFIFVSLVSTALQVMLVQVGGEWVKTSPLNVEQWFGTIAIGFIGIPIGILMRFIPVKEDEGTFFIHTGMAAGGGGDRKGMGTDAV